MSQRYLSFPLVGMMLLLGGCQLLPATLTKAAFPTSIKAIQNATQPTPSIDIQRWQTAAGSKVLFVANSDIPMVDVQLTFAGGSSRDGDAPGLAQLTSSLIGEDTRSGLDSDAIVSGFESNGASFNTGSYRDMAIIHLRSLSDDTYLTPDLDLLKQVLAPRFSVNNIRRIRTQMLQGLKMQQQVPGPKAREAYMKALFSDHPYAHKPDGTAQSLSAINRKQIQAFYQQYYSAGNVTIALVGDLSREQAKAIAKQISKALPQGSHAPTLPTVKPAKAKLLSLPFASSQTHILIGSQSIKRGDADWPALYVGSWILGGGGFASRLTQAVRVDKGLAYSISSSISPMAASGVFTIGLETANASAQQALDITLDQTRKFIETGPTEAEVQKAIDNISGSFPLSIASNSNIVGQLGAIGFYHLPDDYLTHFIDQIRQLTAAEVKAALERHINPDQLLVVTVGPKPLQLPQASDKAATTEDNNESPAR